MGRLSSQSNQLGRSLAGYGIRTSNQTYENSSEKSGQLRTSRSGDNPISRIEGPREETLPQPQDPRENYAK